MEPEVDVGMTGDLRIAYSWTLSNPPASISILAGLIVPRCRALPPGAVYCFFATTKPGAVSYLKSLLIARLVHGLVFTKSVISAVIDLRHEVL